MSKNKFDISPKGEMSVIKEAPIAVAGGEGSGRVGKVKRDYSVHDRVEGVEKHWFLKKGEEVSEEKMPKAYWDLLRRENVI